MDNNQNWNLNLRNQPGLATQPVTRTFFASVFMWMGIALGISAITAYVFGTDASYMQYLTDMTTGKPTGLGYLTIFAPLGLVLLMSFGMERLSSTALISVFLIFSILMGMSLSYIFLIYTTGSIYGVFFGSAAMFSVMALLGYTTKTDLTKLGSILFMALIGIIIASLINMFMRSNGLYYIISIISVIIFTGLTAYKVQMLKEMGTQVENGTEAATKMSIFGALTLYITFINLFLALLRLFGSRRD